MVWHGTDHFANVEVTLDEISVPKMGLPTELQLIVIRASTDRRLSFTGRALK
jgi:hypothetical protein